MSTVVVTGASGQVGRDLVDWLRGSPPPGSDPRWQPDGAPVSPGEFFVRPLGREQLDVTNDAAVEEMLAQLRPSVLVNLAAYTAVDRAEAEPERCREVNDRAVGTLSQHCERFGVHFITISTDYVFDGTKGRAYRESDAPHPLNVYGSSKWAGEQRCRPSDTVVRTSWVMGVRGANVAHVIADRVERGESVRFVEDQVGTATMAADLARALVTMVRERPGGLWHVANQGAASWFDVARAVARVAVGSDALVSPITTAQLSPPPLAQRPTRSDLATERWIDAGWQPLPPWSDGISRLVGDR